MNKIELTKTPETSDIDFITKQINQETSEYGEAYPFALFIRDNDSKIIDGTNGFVIYGSIYTDPLWVDKDYRRQGFAKKIMAKIHEFGKLEGLILQMTHKVLYKLFHYYSLSYLKLKAPITR